MGGALLAIVVVALAAWLMSMALHGVGYAAGLSGTPGTLTAARCHTTGSHRTSRRVCTGTFISADGSVTDARAHITNARVDIGRPTGLRRKTDGGYVQPGWTKAGLDLAGAFAILAGVGLSLVVSCVMMMRDPAEDAGSRETVPRPWKTPVSVLVWVFALSVTAAPLSVLAGVLTGLLT